MESEGTNVFQISTILIAGFVSVCVYLLFYILKQINGEEKNVENIKKNEKRVELSEKKKDSSASAKSKKKAAWTGRTDKQSFTHPWLLTSLKGHTGEVLDMDFASNGKYLVSCAEEEPDPGGKLDGSTGSSGSNTDSSQENSLPSENPSPRTGLSRRQRKNRRRDDLSPENKKKYRGRKDPISRKPIVHTPLKQYLKMNCIPEPHLASLMQTFFLSPEQMLIMGYPLQGVGYNMASRTYIFKSPLTMPKIPAPKPQKHAPKVKESKFDVNAQEFVPGMEYAEIKAEWSASHDSGQGSASSSVSEENLDDSEESSTSLDCYTQPPTENDSKDDQRNFYEIGESHNCVRCSRIFFISHSGEYLTQEQCVYHWGKLHNVIAAIGKHSKACDYVMEYSCCKGKPQSRGCTTGKLHVWGGLSVGFNGPYDYYVRTRPRKTLPPDGNFGIYALDCEMCYTVMGLELTKITVIGVDGRLVYDSFVKPENEIIDYNTRFSGITCKDLSKKSGTKTLREVQNDLMGFINADTILIGHGLENDLRALRIMHYTIIDTAVVFAHPYGLPYRRGLKAITSWILKRDIQCSSSGHNSYEDARACMELILWKVHQTVLLWNAKDLKQKDRKSVRINIEFDYATFVKWSPDSKAFLIHKYNGNCIEVYKIEKKVDGTIGSATKAITFPKVCDDDVVGMDIASSGKFIITCSNKTDLVVWDLRGQQLAKIDTYLMNTYCAKISCCGKYIVASGFAPDVKVWEVIFNKSGEFQEAKRIFDLTGHTSGVYDVAFDVDTSNIATVSKDGTWKLFNTKVDYKRGEDPRLKITGKCPNKSDSAKIALTPNAEVVVIATANNVSLFSTTTGELHKTIEKIFTDKITSIKFDSSGKYLLVTGDRHIRVFHNVTGYYCEIETAKVKLKQRQSSATKERLQQLICDNEAFLKKLGVD
ncbi:hypothetical protein RN001_012996 [Aquatica leii]|uniref:Exonuclease domain-containing protein n=1 Tax=Aquatica leii TaxID=1421715 RepID=A0AAN7P3R6_9COLE|nr:hypothetical protein RN001_012996 [Aquatica leii]